MTYGSIPIWLDCDPGNDDAFAILLATFDENFELLGISTVHGNAPLSSTTHNALGVLDTLGVEAGTIPVYAGSSEPLEKTSVFALDVHGVKGIGSVDLPANPKTTVSKNKTYLEAMKDSILEHENEICLVCTGPMTNISNLFSTYPDLKLKIRYITIMGGAIDMGNITPYAEFNFNCDPLAASNVLSDQVLQNKCVLSPLNFTHTAIATSDIRERIYHPTLRNSPIRKQFHDMLMFYAESYKNKHGFREGPPIHDPLALYCLLPMIFTNETYGFKYIRSKVKVEVDQEIEGQLVLLKSSNSEREGVFIGESIDIRKFWDHIIQALDEAEILLSTKTN